MNLTPRTRYPQELPSRAGSSRLPARWLLLCSGLACGQSSPVDLGIGLPAELAVDVSPCNSQEGVARDWCALQVIKGWIDVEGRMHNEVITVAEADEGQGSFCKIWVDEGFDADLPTYYYLRAIEPQTPRWHTYDCDRIKAAERPAVCSDGSYPKMTTEMAWSSPIWYQPEAD